MRPEAADPLDHLRDIASAEGYPLGQPPPADVLAYLPVIE